MQLRQLRHLLKRHMQFQDKYVETVNYLTESVKDLVETYSIEKLFAGSK